MLAYLNSYADGCTYTCDPIEMLAYAGMCDWALHTGACLVGERLAWTDQSQPARLAAFVDGAEHRFGACITGRISLAKRTWAP